MHIAITKHAVKRFRERFRLQFNSGLLSDPERIRHHMYKLFGEAVCGDFALMQRPGNYNAVCTRHGLKVRLKKYKNLVFVYTQTERKEIILTVLREGMKLHGGYKV